MTSRGSGRAAGICAVIVTHNPALPRLKDALLAVTQQVGQVVMVDNCSHAAIGEWLAARSTADVAAVLRMSANVGIAAALNRGIEWARARGFADVLLLDHDSVPAPDMVEWLVGARQELERQGIRVAAVGPEFRDEKYPGVSPFYQSEGWRIARRSCAGKAAGATVPAECLITSGSLISMEALSGIGLMESDLLVDYVDIEWGLRAGSLGFRCFVGCGAVMDHQLGDAVRAFFGITVPPRLQHFRMMTLGIAHALMNRAGKLG